MSADSKELDVRLDLARKIAREAGQLTLRFFRGDQYVVERKDDDSPVTIADRQAEELLRKRIEATFPADAIVGEECGNREGTSEFRWILDPIDGTTSFISGVPLYGTLVGVEYRQRSIIGVIHIPVLDELIYAGQDRGAWYSRAGGAPVAAHVSRSERLADGLFVTSQIDLFEQRDAGQVFRELQRRAYITRTWGDCYGYLLVATGRADLMVDPVMRVWDAAPMQPIPEESGGVFTDWLGESTVYHGEGIATTRQLLPEVLEITRSFAQP